MSVTLTAALLLQAVCVMLLRLRLGWAWLRRPVTVLVLTSCVYDGIAPALLAIPSVRAQDPYRDSVTPQYADQAALLLSAAILALTVAYLLTRPERLLADPPEEIRGVMQVLDWRLLGVACVPLAVLTYEGRGYNEAAAIGAPGTSAASELAATLFVIMMVLTAFALVLQRGPAWFLPVLAAQSLLLAAAGERTPVIVDAIVLIILLCSVGMRPSFRQLNAAIGLTLLAVLVLTGSRAVEGRAAGRSGGGLGARVSSLSAGVSGITGSPGTGPSLTQQAAERLDGVAFTAGILQAEKRGQPRLSAAYFPQSLLITVPSALWPSKLAHGEALDPVLYESQDFGMSSNLLPGLPGLYAGFLAPAWLIAFSALCGLLAGWGEKWLLRRWTPARMVLLAGAVTAAMRFEQGAPGILLALRSAVVIAVAARVLQTARGRSRARALEPRRLESPRPAHSVRSG